MFQEKFPLTPTPIFFLSNFEIFTPLIDFMKTFAYHPLLICCQATSPIN